MLLQECKDAEAEHVRIAAEGPAHHRKKDLLDKATKEAEHRERLQDLQQRIAAVKERIMGDEGTSMSWTNQHTVGGWGRQGREGGGGWGRRWGWGFLRVNEWVGEWLRGRRL